MGFKKHWPWLAAALLWAAPIWNFFIWLLDLRGRIDALAETYHDVGGAHAIVGYILNPPPWLSLPAIFSGVILIWWDLRRNRNSQDTARFNAQQAEIKTTTEKEKYEAVARWLKSLISKREYSAQPDYASTCALQKILLSYDAGLPSVLSPRRRDKPTGVFGLCL
jgi:hypothetical protein